MEASSLQVVSMRFFPKLSWFSTYDSKEKNCGTKIRRGRWKS
jgi:hypothetical protein